VTRQSLPLEAASTISGEPFGSGVQLKMLTIVLTSPPKRNLVTPTQCTAATRFASYIGFQPIADTSPMREIATVYRKDATRHIARDVSKRLSEMRRKDAWADWRMALIATRAAHPDWFKHGETEESLEPLLREAGVDMSRPEEPFGFVGNDWPNE
jgi:hypothetical protein